MELNRVELALKEIYDDWKLGNEKENNGYSAMFRMGFPNEYINSSRPLLMYVGQECLDCTPTKTQEWIRKYQIVQRTRIYNEEIDRKTNKSPFWNLYRRLCECGYDVVWNNLDKFHPLGAQRLPAEDGRIFNHPYGEDKQSVLQREITLLKPKVLVLAIGNGKYTSSLASALSLSEEELREYEPNHETLVNGISHLLGAEAMTVLWTYHPNHLQLSKNYRKALNEIKQLIDTRRNR